MSNSLLPHPSVGDRFVAVKRLWGVDADERLIAISKETFLEKKPGIRLFSTATLFLERSRELGEQYIQWSMTPGEREAFWGAVKCSRHFD